MKSLVVCTAFISLVLITVAQGQIDSTSAPSDTYIDNIVDSTIAETTQVETTAALKNRGPFLAPSPTPSPSWLKVVSMTYNFSDGNSKLSDGTETVGNSVKTELYLESPSQFALTSSFAFQNLSRTDNFGNLSDTDVYTFSLQPAHDFPQLLHLIDPAIKKEARLIPGLGLGYSRFEGDSSGKSGRFTSEADAYSISPNVVFSYPFLDEKGVKVTTLIVNPTYTMQWKDTTKSGGREISTNAGLFTLLGRVDHRIAEGWSGTISTTWKHDVNQKVAPGQTARLRDWAEFGVALRYEIIKNVMKIKWGYSYEAFHSDFDTHKVTAAAEMAF
jgi:hypothetical protein